MSISPHGVLTRSPIQTRQDDLPKQKAKGIMDSHELNTVTLGFELTSYNLEKMVKDVQSDILGV